MKKFKRILASILCISILFSSTIYAQNSVEHSTNNQVAVGQFDSERQIESYENYKKLIASFPKKNNEIGYPIYYAGAYLNDNSDLIICVVNWSKDKDETEIRKEIEKIIPKGKFNIKVVKYNYLILSIIINYLNQYMRTNKGDSVRENISCFFLDEEDNSIKLELEDNSPDKVKQFREQVTNHRSIKIIDVDILLDHNTNSNKKVENKESLDGKITVKPEGKISTFDNSGNEQCAMVGYKAKDNNGRTGIVVPEHMMKESCNDKIYIEKKCFGKFNKHPDYDDIDAGFVENENPDKFVVTNQIVENGRKLNTKIEDGMQGMQIYQQHADFNFTRGKIISTKGSIYSDGIFNTDFVFTNVKTKEGKSGSPSMIRIGNTDEYSPVGTLSVGGPVGKNEAEISCFTKVSNTKKRLGVNLTD